VRGSFSGVVLDARRIAQLSRRCALDHDSARSYSSSPAVETKVNFKISRTSRQLILALIAFNCPLVSGANACCLCGFQVILLWKNHTSRSCVHCRPSADKHCGCFSMNQLPASTCTTPLLILGPTEAVDNAKCTDGACPSNFGLLPD